MQNTNTTVSAPNGQVILSNAGTPTTYFSATYSNFAKPVLIDAASAGSTAPATSAILDVASTTKGVLLPRMTTTQMNAISSTATGLMLYNTDANINMTYNATAWKSTGVVSGSFSGAGTATTTFTVTFGGTQPNSTYKVNVTPTASLSAALFYVTNKTTTTFDVVYLAGLTGTVTFDWSVYQ